MQQNIYEHHLPSYLRPFDADPARSYSGAAYQRPPSFYYPPHAAMLTRPSLTPSDSGEEESPRTSPNFQQQPHPHVFRPVDFESCAVPRRQLSTSTRTSSSSSDSESLQPPKQLPPPPSSQDISGVTVSLLDEELWDSFDSVGNEMIVTKPGRRLFPCLMLTIRGLPKKESFEVSLRFTPADDYRYKFLNRAWVVARESEVQQDEERQRLLHPMSPSTGEAWMKKPVSFKPAKITHNSKSKHGNILLHTMHKYVMELVVKQVGAERTTVIRLPKTSFIAVTAYQNVKLTQMKINNNPFAKGFRERGESTASMMSHPLPPPLVHDHYQQQQQQPLWQMPPPPPLVGSGYHRYSLPSISEFPYSLGEIPSPPYYSSGPLHHLSPPPQSADAMMPPFLPPYNSQQLPWSLPPPRPLSQSTTVSSHSYSADCSDLEDL